MKDLDRMAFELWLTGASTASLYVMLREVAEKAEAELAEAWREMKWQRVEVERLRGQVQDMNGYKHCHPDVLLRASQARAERAEAEVARLRGERKAVEHVLIQHGVSSSLAVQHLIDDVRTALRGEGEKKVTSESK